MTQRRFRPLPLVVFALCGTFGRDLSAQDREVSIGVGQFVSRGEGVGPSCLEYGSHNLVRGRLAVPVRSSRVSLALTARAPAFSVNGCVSVPGPLPNGTFDLNDRVSVLVVHYLATDVRVGMQFGPRLAAARLSLGGGRFWRSGEDFPYVLAATELTIRPTRWLHVAAEWEYDHLRIVSNPVRYTYQLGHFVSRESLGISRPWSHATSLGVAVGVSW